MGSLNLNPPKYQPLWLVTLSMYATPFSTEKCGISPFDNCTNSGYGSCSKSALKIEIPPPFAFTAVICPNPKTLISIVRVKTIAESLFKFIFLHIFKSSFLFINFNYFTNFILPNKVAFFVSPIPFVKTAKPRLPLPSLSFAIMLNFSVAPASTFSLPIVSVQGKTIL